ncbi:Histone acetylase PCAF [Trema orientale]|uniref:Histone acetylase PCAF n=1 Tax=Trema orientale TaxID=63057 RepID=A0A2P5F3X8_TREOI|nr:Histone acetylase PCAF [Trema orientale]
MSTGEQRRSARISELDARRAQQAKSQNKDKGTCEVAIEDSSTGESDLNLKRGRKKVKIRSVQDLDVNTFGNQVGNSGYEDHQSKSAVTSAGTGTALPTGAKLELLLGVLMRRDLYNIFAEPVDPDEVKGYYDTIKEPMDFGTISIKLSGGSYKTLQEFEHDVFLVSGNAMVFNPSNTVYYREACAIRELAQKLFDALKTDPENFESVISIMNLGAGRRIRSGAETLNSGSCNQPTSRIASKGRSFFIRQYDQNDDERLRQCQINFPFLVSTDCREERSFEKDQCGDDRPCDSFLDNSESVVSSVYESQKTTTKKTKLSGAGYVSDSLTQFAKDTGSAAQLVSGKKLQRCTTAKAFSHHYQIPYEASGYKGIPNVSSLDFLKNSTRSQNLSGKMSISGDKVNVQKALTFDINDTSCTGFVQSGAYGGPNFTTWNNARSNSNSFISNTINNDKNVQKADASCSHSKENPGNRKRKFFEAVTVGENKSYQGGIPNLSTTLNTCRNQDKCISSSINKGKNFQMAEGTTSNPKRTPIDKFVEAMKEGKNKSYQGGCPNFSTTWDTGSKRNNISSSIDKGKNLQMAVAISNPRETPVDRLRKLVETVRKGEKKSSQGGIPNSSTAWDTGSNQDNISCSVVSCSVDKGKILQMAAAASNTKETPVDQLIKFMEAVSKGENKSYQSGIPNFSTTCNIGRGQDKFISSFVDKGKNLQMAAATSNCKETPAEQLMKLVEAVRKGENKSYQCGIPSSSPTWNTGSSQEKFISNSDDNGKNLQMAAATSNCKETPAEQLMKLVEAVKKGVKNSYRGGIPSSSTTWNTGSSQEKFISDSDDKGKNLQMAAATSNCKETPADQLMKLVEAVRKGENKSYQCRIPSSSTTWNTGSSQEKFISDSDDKGKNLQMAEATSNCKETPADQLMKLVEAVRKGENKSYQGGIPNSSTTWNTGSSQDTFMSSTDDKGKNLQMAAATSNCKETPVEQLMKLVEAVRKGETRSQDKFISSSDDKGKNLQMAEATSNCNVTDQLMKLVEAVRKWENMSYQGGIPNFPATWNRSSNQEEFFSSSIDKGKNLQMAEAISSSPKKTPVDPRIEFFESMKEEATAWKKDLRDQGIQKSNSAPGLSGAGNSYFFSAENGQSKQSVLSATIERKNVPMVAMDPASILENVANIIGKTVQSLRAAAAVSKEHVTNQGTESTPSSTPLPVGGNSYSPAPLNTGSNPGQSIPTALFRGVNVQIPGRNHGSFIPTPMINGSNVQIPGRINPGNFIPTPMNRGMNGQRPGMTSSCPILQGTLPARGRGVPPCAPRQRFPPPITGSSWNQACPIPGSDVNFPGGGLNRLQAVDNANYGGQFLRPGQTWIPRRPMQSQPPPIFASSMQMLPRPPQVNFAGQIPFPLWRGQGTTAAANGQVIVNPSAMNMRYPNRDPRQNLSTGVPQYDNHGKNP